MKFYSFLLSFITNKKPCHKEGLHYKYKNLSDLSLFLKKKFFKSLLVLTFLMSCSSSDLERNPFLSEFSFRFQVNLNLPEYDDLRYAGGSILIPQLGNKGVLVFNLNGNDFFAWEASCPNHLPNSCSQTQIKGVLAECSCEKFQYSLATGQLLNPTEGENVKLYPLLFYQTENRGNSVIISN
jgi:nitrite reductase/ring-hydroxylating ferredoxin subunit|tara:strand:- start:2690 stop:3235 length:546 start_codon:yes stop_codon:yes gene_type:complete